MSPEPPTVAAASTELVGLSAAEVAARIDDGLCNTLPPRTGKTYRDIVRSNVFTRINAILFVLFVMVISTGSWINSAFGLLIVVNSGIGMVQEIRAKRTLESLTLLNQEKQRVWRDGELVELTQEELVLDDYIQLKSGTQIVVDGTVVAAEQLRVDESLLTGESDAIVKSAGAEVLSGSFVTSGTGVYQVTKVGAESYAAQLAAEASKFTLTKSQLQQGINQILKYITWVLIPVGLLTIFSQVNAGVRDWRAVILQITGALVPMVPEGLVLITSTAFALGVIRLGRQSCLVQELPAIEGLARVDVVCADKTGTLTENTLEFAELIPCADTDADSARSVLAQVMASDPDPNDTAAAILAAVPLETAPWEVTDRQPFDSERKWSAVTFAGAGTFRLGAPDVLAGNTETGAQAEEISSQGLRVLLLGKENAAGTTGAADGEITPICLIVLEQKIRPDAGETLSYFGKQEVRVKVISGDNATSVAAVTRNLGMSDSAPLDAREITDMSAAVTEYDVFGRVRPEQKREMVHALQAAGHTVAMTGDGVNDVLALKDADIGVAMGSGAPATRAVANIVLLNNQFATLPVVVGEGRRVIGNIERVAKLFLTKTIYSAILAILVILAAVPFPFVPIHVTITGWFTIGIPAFVLALPPNNDRARGGFVRRVMRFAFPSGLVVGIFAFTSYLVAAGGTDIPLEHTQESTAALATLIMGSTWVLACVARPWNWWKLLLIVLPVVGYGLIFTLPLTQQLFYLDATNLPMMAVALALGAGAAVCVEILWRVTHKYF
ncbi:MAG: HAD-IC family P-type ATPase [Trueperella sp.]|nr:HAD-IC family P-type ATPase [Trueperella sp.]